jgi:hypothetical protein
VPTPTWGKASLCGAKSRKRKKPHKTKKEETRATSRHAVKATRGSDNKTEDANARQTHRNVEPKFGKEKPHVKPKQEETRATNQHADKATRGSDKKERHKNATKNTNQNEAAKDIINKTRQKSSNECHQCRRKTRIDNGQAQRRTHSQPRTEKQNR